MTKLAFVFPGQGSQEVGMLEDAREACADLFAEASSVLGYDLWDLVENGPEDQLNQTEYTQPALLTLNSLITSCAGSGASLARCCGRPQSR